MAEKSWLTEFPQMDREDLISIRKSLDGTYREFSREYGEMIEGFFDPLLSFLVAFEKLLVDSPWWAVLAIIIGLVYLASRSWKLSVGIAIAMYAVGYFGMWEDTMRTLSIITVSTLTAIVLGIPIGILMARSNRVQSIVTPTLDIMQTMPAFVYLVPVVMLLGIGKIPGLIAVVIYAVAPVIRLTNLGIRMVDSEVLEAATAYGATPFQRLIRVQLPLSLPNIMAGVNQTIMMALSMVVVASMIGVKGLGQPVLKSITNQYFTMGLLNGLAIVVLAIMFDRSSQAYAKRTNNRVSSH
jgi:glycine betaine/proline transport system permease protein